MCFRPSAVSYDSNMQSGACPNCGMPVAAEPGVTSGTCPNCGSYIPPDPSFDPSQDPDQNYRVL